MRRLTIDPRPNWQKRVEEYGLYYHTIRDEPYWDESACYQFTNYEVDTIEEATQRPARHVHGAGRRGDRQADVRPVLHPQGVRGVRHPVVGVGRAVGVRPVRPRVRRRRRRRRCWSTTPTRPTALVEAAVAQWVWLKDMDERGDQFNSIHEQLIDAWKAVLKRDAGPIHFAAMSKLDTPEDYITAEYMRDTAIQAGCEDLVHRHHRHRLGPRPAVLRGQHRVPDPPVLQAVPVGVDGEQGGGVRPARPGRDVPNGSSRRGR